MLGSINRMLVVAVALLVLPALAMAQSKVGVANTARIFNEMQETRDLQQQLEQERLRMEDTVRQKREQIRTLQEARDQLKPDSPQYQERNRELIQATVEFETWGKLMQMEIQRNQKQRIATLFGKVEAAVATVAKQRGLDIVIAEQAAELPDNLDAINIDQLRALLNARNVLYAAETVNITEEVLAHLDAQYKGGR